MLSKVERRSKGSWKVPDTRKQKKKVAIGTFKHVEVGTEVNVLLMDHTLEFLEQVI